jgi:hypothetical protein
MIQLLTSILKWYLLLTTIPGGLLLAYNSEIEFAGYGQFFENIYLQKVLNIAIGAMVGAISAPIWPPLILFLYLTETKEVKVQMKSGDKITFKRIPEPLQDEKPEGKDGENGGNGEDVEMESLQGNSNENADVVVSE